MTTITHAQFCELCAALDACTVGMPEHQADASRFELKERLLSDLRVPKAQRYLGRLRLPDLGAIRAADFDQAMSTLQRLAQLPA